MNDMHAVAHAWGVWLFQGEDGLSLANLNLTPDDFASHAP